MKKIILLIGIIVLVFFLVACKQSNKLDDVITEIGESTKFDEEQVSEAIDTVKYGMMKKNPYMQLVDICIYGSKINKRVLKHF